MNGRRVPQRFLRFDEVLKASDEDGAGFVITPAAINPLYVISVHPIRLTDEDRARAAEIGVDEAGMACLVLDNVEGWGGQHRKVMVVAPFEDVAAIFETHDLVSLMRSEPESEQ